MKEYSSRLIACLAAYRKRYLPHVGDGVSIHNEEPTSGPHVLPQAHYRSNILPHIRERFWTGFEMARPRIALHPDFHHLNSSQAMSFNLFFPFLREGVADKRLLDVLRIRPGSGFEGSFDRVFDAEDNTHFDFCLEARSGQKIFFALGLSDGFGGCEDDEHHRQKLERHYRPFLEDHIDRKWLEPATFFSHYRVLSVLSYLGRHPDSGAVFILPRANEGLTGTEQAIKQIASKSLAPRVEIFYLEYLVERILAATADDPDLQKHFLEFREKYIC